MFRFNTRIVLFFVVTACLVFSWPAAAQEAETDEPVVQVVLFYSPTCPHCHMVISDFLVPLMDEYGTQLDVLGIDVTTETGSYLYNSAIAYYEIPDARRGVPTLIYKDTVLVGGYEIPEKFPGLFEAGLAAGGVGWPHIPELAAVAEDLPPSTDPNSPQETPTTTSAAADKPTAVTIVLEPEATAVQSLETINTTSIASTETAPPADPVGFALGWLVLLGLVVVLVVSIWQLGGNWAALTQANGRLDENQGRNIVMWALIVIGLIVSGYLAYVEMTQVTAVCGPVGECNIVQSSPYAQILGIPIAVLGLLFYLTVAGLWLLQRVENMRHLTILALIALTIIGTLFSLYLTLVELLVIGAICMWCLTSAVATGLICLLVTTGGVKRPLPPEPHLQTN